MGHQLENEMNKIKHEAEFRETQAIVGSLINKSHHKYESYSFAAGYLQSMVAELIMELPKEKREFFRKQIEGSISRI